MIGLIASMVFMTIDPKTLLVVLTFSTLFLAFILVFYKATRETYPGFSMWVYGTITMAIGAMLLAFRGVVPVGLSVLIGNVAFPIGAVYLLLGTKRFLDLPAPNKFIWLVPLITLLCLIFFYRVYVITAARGVVISLSLTMVNLLTTWLLWRHAPHENKALYYFTGSMLIIASISLSVRSLLWLLFVPEVNLFTRHVSQTIYLLIAIFSQIGWTFGFIMMNGQRMEDDLKESRAKLTKGNQNLTKALLEIKKLSGLLPICANCKKIRDSEDYWHQVESYISQHSEVEFSHSICPECAKILYPDSNPYD